MKKILVVFVSLLITALPWWPAGAASRGNRAGGSTSHTEGSTSHTSAAGTSTSHTAGQGSSHTNEYGGSTSHAYGEGTTHTNAYGGSASHAEGGGWSKTGAAGGTAYGDAHYGTAYHPPTAVVPVYHPPVTVNSYGSSCYNCGGWSTAAAAATGAAVGVVVGASVASAKTAAATSSAYSAGVAAGAAGAAGTTTVTVVQTTYVPGAIYPTVPAGAMSINKNGATYYLSGNTWFQPSYGANGVYYRVVPAP